MRHACGRAICPVQRPFVVRIARRGPRRRGPGGAPDRPDPTRSGPRGCGRGTPACCGGFRADSRPRRPRRGRGPPGASRAVRARSPGARRAAVRATRSPASDRRAGCPTTRAADTRPAGRRARPAAARRGAPRRRASRGRSPPPRGGRRARRTARDSATVRPRNSATRPAIRRPSGSAGSSAAIARRSRLSLVPRRLSRRAANRNRSSWRISSRPGSPGIDSGWRATRTTHGGPSLGSASPRADSSRARRTWDSTSSSSD